MRYHPAVVAQKAATIGLSDDRFTLGLGAGENLNEHVYCAGWPPVNVRHELLAEAVDIISALFDGGYVSYQGDHYRVLGEAVGRTRQSCPHRSCSLRQSVDRAVGVEGRARRRRRAEARARHRVGLVGIGWLAKIGQVPVCWDPDRDTAIKRAHEQFRWFGGGWKVNAELPGPAGFAGASQFVREQDVADSIACGPDIDALVDAVRPFVDAGFTDVALVQVGDERQREFLDFAERELVPALRQTYA